MDFFIMFIAIAATIGIAAILLHSVDNGGEIKPLPIVPFKKQPSQSPQTLSSAIQSAPEPPVFYLSGIQTSPPLPQMGFNITCSVTSDETPRFFKPTVETEDFMMALYFMGKADGQLRENEIFIIADYLRETQPEHEPMPNYYLVDEIRKMRQLSATGYKRYLQLLTQEERNKLLFWSNKIVDTQDKVHPFEKYLLDEITSS